MGQLVEGKWVQDFVPTDSKGRFNRQASQLRNKIHLDKDSEFPLEKDRYHLYVSLACPWAHRVLIARSLLHLQEWISISVVHPHMEEDGWTFEDWKGQTGDSLYQSRFLRDIYTRSDPEYTGRVTVPVLWDKNKETIVNNESREILRMLSEVFVSVSESGALLCPPNQKSKIDSLLDEMYESINNGVYKTGFAKSQEAYEEAQASLFESLEKFDAYLTNRKFLLGEGVTEADICLFTTLVRFDPVYSVHFKCTRKRIQDYPNLERHRISMLEIPEVRSTVSMEHIMQHYYYSHKQLNPSRIVPVIPESAVFESI